MENIKIFCYFKIVLEVKIKELLASPRLKFSQGFSKSQLFLVGGAVRDFILDRETKDFDFIIINERAEQIEKILKDYGKVQAVESRAFGVFKFQPKNSKEIIDIALPRIDHWTGLGYKDLKTEVGVSLSEDLSRRDFTINALAISLNGKLIDRFSGANDIKRKIIRAVGNPHDRFLEDPSRILRGLRLACELDFQIEDKTFTAMSKLASEIIRKTKEHETRVAPEIMAGEFLKGFYANPVKMIKLLDETNILKLILPEITTMKEVEQPENFHSEGDVFVHTMLALDKLPKANRVKSKVKLDPKSIYTKLAVLFHDLGKPKTFKSAEVTGDRIRFTGHDVASSKIVAKIFKRLPLSVFAKDDKLHVDKEKLMWLIKHHMVCVAVDPDNIRFSTIEKYFFNPDNRGGELLALSFADISATVPPNGKPDFSLFDKLIKKLDEVSEIIITKQNQTQLPHLLDGKEIMEATGLKPGPKIGKIKNKLRDLQLSGKLKNKEEARQYLKNSYSK